MRLRALAESDRLKKVLTDTPARLKPLDKDAVRIIPIKVVNAPNTRASLSQDGRTIFLDVDVSTRQPIVQIVASFENQFFPYSIEEARVSALIEGQGWSEPLSVTPDIISKLSPNAGVEVSISLPISVQLPSIWSPRILLDTGRRVSVPAVIQVALNGQKLAVDNSFRARLASIFPGDPLPDVFVPPVNVKSSSAAIPIVLRVNYPLYPLIVALILCLAAIVGALWLFAILKAEKRYRLVVDGQERTVVIRTFKSVKVLLPDGMNYAGEVKRGLGRPRVASVNQGHTLSIGK